MINSDDCLRKYGEPSMHNDTMTQWYLPKRFHNANKVIPIGIYSSKDLTGPLTEAFNNLEDQGLLGLVQSWDGCFNIRKIRGGTAWSLHSWGVAVDLNASTNELGQVPTLTPEFVQCFKDAGFDWGGDFKTRKDGMHFQLRSI